MADEVRNRESSAMVGWTVMSLAPVNIGALARRSLTSYSADVPSHHGHWRSQHGAPAWREGLN